MTAAPRHYITGQFREFDLGQRTQCATGFVELSDGVDDSDHTRRMCVNMRGEMWY